MSGDTYNRRFRLMRVIDGDTVHALIDLGWRTYSEHSIRIANVNAPELFSGTEREAGAAAKAFSEGWFAEHVDHGGSPDWPFVLRSEKDRESFNRYVATIACGAGHNLGDDIVAAGLGIWTRQ